MLRAVLHDTDVVLTQASITAGHDEVDAARSMALRRPRWQPETGFRHMTDVTLGEHRSLIHVGHSPVAMGTLLDTVGGSIRRSGWRAIASRWRHCPDRTDGVVSLVPGIIRAQALIFNM
ncbi:MAG TPA: hypothetical protein VMM78_13880 [Thermomicrobiales bacterium]|nr:hypothetical protein [Thermomicrobiales bacterium]